MMHGMATPAIVLTDRFGDRVADIVWACTDADVMPKPPWRARKEAYLAHLETAEEAGAVGARGGP